MTGHNHHHPDEARIQSALNHLKKIPPRDARKAQKGKAAFLAEAGRMQPAVSPAMERRHKGWILWIPTLFERKDAKSMLKFALPILMVLVLVLGSGVTTTAAQSAIPGDTLYPVKIWSEDVRLNLASRLTTRINLNLQFADERIDEAAGLLSSGCDLPEALLTRLELHINNALMLSADQEASQAMRALEQVRTRLEEQQRLLSRIKAGSTLGEGVLIRMREMIQNRLHLVESGLEDPVQLRQQLRNRVSQPTEEPTGTTPGGGYGPGGPGNPWTTGTPTPYSGYGPGEPQNPWTTGTPTPYSGYGPGDPQNPWATGTPTPGNGDGSGNPSMTPGGPSHP